MSRSFNFKPLVNVRQQRDVYSDKMIATSVLGSFRIPPKVALALNIEEFDTVSLFSDTNEETLQTYVFIGKGKKGTALLNEDGSHQVTENRGTIIYDENDPSDGALVRATTEGSDILCCTSAAAWKALGGGTDKELELEIESIGEMDYPLPSGDMVFGEVFELTVAKTRVIEKRKSKSKSTAQAESTDVEAEIAQAEGMEEEEV